MEDTNQAQMPPQIPQPEESAPPGSSEPAKDSSKNLYILLGGLMFLVIGTGSFVILSQKQTNKQSSAWHQQNPQDALPSVSQTSAVQPTTPIISPVTSSNVDQTLSNTDSTMQQSIDQANTDLNLVNNIDQTQDNTNGL